MQQPTITFFPGKGIYSLPAGEEIVSVHATEEARAIFAGDASVRGKAKQLQRFYEQQNIAIEQKPVLSETRRFDFGTVEHFGTRSSAHVCAVDWGAVEDALAQMGYHLRQRTPISDEIGRLAPVYLIEGPEGVLAEGKGLDQEQAKRSTLGEAVERLAARGPSERVRAQRGTDTYQNLYRGKDWGLGTLAGPRDAFDSQIPSEWLPARNISRDETAFLPAELSYFEYVPETTRTRLFSLHHTMGLAAGSSREDAALSGIFEVIERDAYWITMRCRMNLPDIPLEAVRDLDPKVIAIVQALEKRGFKLSVKDLSLDWGVPVVHAVLVDTQGGIPAFAHGTGASFSWATAVARAVCESVQMYEGLSAVMNDEWKWEDVVSVAGVLGNAAYAWSDPLFRPHIEHLLAPSDQPWDGSEPAWSVPEFLADLKQRGHEVIVADLGSDYGLEVVRVFITNTTQPDPRLERISLRLEAWRNRLGLERGLYTDPILT
ncbi:MAG TPA: YcaO-like family protein [Candidatus Paceibacterota bacterium]|nr:YcaO-like family protein [Candidatus Paceibacterota bacterium]